MLHYLPKTLSALFYAFLHVGQLAW